VDTTRLFTVCVCATLLAVPHLTVSLQPAGPLVFERDIRQTLNSLAQALNKEFVLCLTGHLDDDDTARVTGIVVPSVTASSETSVLFGRCPLGTVALWHNHLPDRKSKTQAHRCYMSSVDLRSAVMRHYPYWVVQVDDRHICWFTRQQAYAAHNDIDIELLPAVDGQYDFYDFTD
jgi:hypothetical protein